MNRFCTLFDSNYLTRGLCLYNSLVRSGESFELVVYCFDDLTHRILERLSLPHLQLVALTEFETPELKRVRPQRTVAEYCWTCTPFVIRDTIERFGGPEATYLDADLSFFGPPSALLEELHQARGSVLITEHRCTPRYDLSKTHGIYCVQFVTFVADRDGLETLGWWQDRCLEWCFNRVEDGKFGDQKYLDDWPRRFKGVHVLQHPGGGIAPWNVQQYRIGPGPTVDGIPAIFYHFHALRWLRSGFFDLCGWYYEFEPAVVDTFYKPYVSDLKLARAQVRTVEPDFDRGRADGLPSWKLGLGELRQRAKGYIGVIPA